MYDDGFDAFAEVLLAKLKNGTLIASREWCCWDAGLMDPNTGGPGKYGNPVRTMPTSCSVRSFRCHTQLSLSHHVVTATMAAFCSEMISKLPVCNNGHGGFLS